ncbi:acyltransferase family protein [Granulicatella sp. zg-84]|nr:acyltransferase family protein [Granulicatella sp. zg-84]
MITLKKRLFYLDFIRAVAVISIVLTHYNAVFFYRAVQLPEKTVFTYMVGGIPIGSWGVSLFLIISGAALMYTYNDSICLKTFYKKRLLTLFPMFYLVYSVVFFVLPLGYRAFSSGIIPRKNILFTLIGMDGYLSEVVPTFYLVGEWFLGFIILLYIIFPLLRKGVTEYPKSFAVISLMVYIFLVFNYHIPFHKEKFLLLRLPEVLFGMYFVKYMKKVSVITLIGSLCVFLSGTLFSIQIDQIFKITLIGISSFLILVYVSEKVKNKYTVSVSAFLCKYSYAIFLVHHVIIDSFMSRINLDLIGLKKSYAFFFVCLVLIGIASMSVYKLDSIINKKIFNK